MMLMVMSTCYVQDVKCPKGDVETWLLIGCLPKRRFVDSYVICYLLGSSILLFQLINATFLQESLAVDVSSGN